MHTPRYLRVDSVACYITEGELLRIWVDFSSHLKLMRLSDQYSPHLKPSFSSEKNTHKHSMDTHTLTQQEFINTANGPPW